MKHKSIRTLSLVAAALCLAAGGGQAQQAAERYIPIGKSPGVSNVYTWLGEVVTTNTEDRTVTVRNPQGTRTIKITDTTDIWIDRSQFQQPNTTGTFADLVTGRTIEVKYLDDQTRDTARWIKVAMPG